VPLPKIYDGTRNASRQVAEVLQALDVVRYRQGTTSTYQQHYSRDARLKVVNNFSRKFEKILKMAGVRKRKFHCLRNTALTNWFANGMSEHDVMTLAGHSSFSTTHEFYLAVADDLVDRARVAAEQSVDKNLAHIWHAPYFSPTTKKADSYKQLPANDLRNGQGRI
jgi:integrase